MHKMQLNMLQMSERKQQQKPPPKKPLHSNMMAESGQLPRAVVIFSIHVCVLVFMYMCVSLLRGLNLEYWGTEIGSPCNYLLVHTSTFDSNSAPTFRGQGLERGRLPWQPQSSPRTLRHFVPAQELAVSHPMNHTAQPRQCATICMRAWRNSLADEV